MKSSSLFAISSFFLTLCPLLMGVRIEYVEGTAMEAIEEWARTGKYSGGIGG